MGYKLGYHILVLPNQVLLINIVLTNQILILSIFEKCKKCIHAIFWVQLPFNILSVLF